MPTPIPFRLSVIERREDGDLVIALMDGLPAPLDQVQACVALLTCSPETAAAMCADIAGCIEKSGAPGPTTWQQEH